MSAVERVTCKPAVFPYFAEKDSWPPDTISGIYRKLVEQDILADLCHEKHVSEEEFVAFVNNETLSFLFMDLVSNQICGIAWLSLTQETDCFKKGWGAFAFFREWWNPKITKVFGHLVLSHWVNFLGYDLVCGLTPASNRLAVRYCKSLGFDYAAVLPKYTTYRGIVSDGCVAMLTRERLNSILDKYAKPETNTSNV